jgi:hypothetical protein
MVGDEQTVVNYDISLKLDVPYKHLKISELGKGTCKKNPIIALGSFFLNISGTNSRW